MRKIEAVIVADSINPQGNRITSMLLTFPRFILAELNTHRVFTKNSASSRAIPAKKLFESVETDPFIPIAWQKEHSGMQGTEYFEHPDTIRVVRAAWGAAADSALSCSKALNGIKVTKQLSNRLLEPFLWHTVLLTSTEFENFFDLRAPKYPGDGASYIHSKEDVKEFLEQEGDNLTADYTDLDWIKKSESPAEIHIQALAEAMWVALKHSTPKTLQVGEWHVPFGDQLVDDDILPILYTTNAEPASLSDYKVKIATARCARLSYMTFDGAIDYTKDLILHDDLLSKRHMSPFEHCARAMSDSEFGAFIKGELSMIPRKGFVAHPFIPDIFIEESALGWCNNFKGFIQYRYLLEKNNTICN